MLTWLEKSILKVPDESATDASGWNYKNLLFALCVTFLMQIIILPCLCYVGDARIRMAFIVDGFVILRTIIAGIFHERGRGWIFYTLLLYSSLLWIPLLIPHSS